MENATVSSLYCIALYDIVYVRLSVSASLTAYAIPP
jgi:hypothetical protein